MSDYLEDPERPPDKVYFTKQEVIYDSVCRASVGRVSKYPLRLGISKLNGSACLDKVGVSQPRFVPYLIMSSAVYRVQYFHCVGKNWK